ncbi:MAG: hypothetical protein ACM359_17325 [Bacillota bacterium]
MPQQTHSVELTGLDGSNPLAFLAALGVLHLVSRGSHSAALSAPKMTWVWRGAVPHPQIITSSAFSSDQLVALLLDELMRDFSAGNRPSYLYNDIIATKPDHFRAMLAEAMSMAGTPREHVLTLLSGFASEACLQHTGKQAGLVEPSIISFANRQSYRYLLDDYMALVVGLTTGSSSYPALDAPKLREALFDHWTYQDHHKELRWDPSELRLAALPSQSEATVHGANALAFWALAVLTSAPTSDGLRTLGIRTFATPGGRLEHSLVMPIWYCPAGLDAVRALLASSLLSAQAVDWEQLQARGIKQLFVSQIITYQKANYFAPAVAL